jgi:hypothetical protein
MGPFYINQIFEILIEDNWGYWFRKILLNMYYRNTFVIKTVIVNEIIIFISYVSFLHSLF